MARIIVKKIAKNKSVRVIISATLILCLVAVFFAEFINASFNEKINYQGKLTDSTGVAVPDATYCMKFRLMDALTDGSELWAETWTAADAKVSTTSGLFSVLLGSHTSISSVVFNSASLYLEVQFDPGCDTVYEEVFSPRQQLGAVPAAFEAKNLQGATWAAPGYIGSATPATGSFTTLSATNLSLTNELTTTYGGTGQDWSAVATGSMPYFGGTGSLTTLSAATSGYVLTSNGANTAPSWAAAAVTGVPYTGATDSVDLGAYNLTATGMTVGSGGLTINNSGITTDGANIITGDTTWDFGSLNITTLGIMTADSFSGDGSGLSGVVTTESDPVHTSWLSGPALSTRLDLGDGAQLSDTTYSGAIITEEDGQIIDWGVNYNQAGIWQGGTVGGWARFDLRAGLENEFFSIKKIDTDSSESSLLTISNIGSAAFAGTVSASNFSTAGTGAFGSLTLTNPLTTTYGGTGQAWNAVATGSMPYFSGTGAMSTLAAATSGYVFTANGANTAPSWQANGLSGYVPYTGATTNVDLGTHTLTANGLTLSNYVTSTGNVMYSASGETQIHPNFYYDSGADILYAGNFSGTGLTVGSGGLTVNSSGISAGGGIAVLLNADSWDFQGNNITLNGSTINLTGGTITNIASISDGTSTLTTGVTPWVLDTTFQASALTDGTFSVTLGAITGATWNGNAIGTQYGGTGQAWNTVATGSMPYFSGTGAMSTLAAATSGFVFTANGANTAPSWQVAAGGGVPYTGATADVDLGSYKLTTTGTGTFGAVKTGLIYPTVDSTSSIIFTKADGSTPVLTLDTTNKNSTFANNVRAVSYIFNGDSGAITPSGISSYYDYLLKTWDGSAYTTRMTIGLDGDIKIANKLGIGAGAATPTRDIDISYPVANSGWMGIRVADTAGGLQGKILTGVLESSDGSYSLAGIWLGTDVPSFTNPAFIEAGSGAVAFNATAGGIYFRIGNANKWTITAAGNLVSGADGTSAFNFTTAGTGTFSRLTLTNPLTTTYGGTGQAWNAVATGSMPYFSGTGAMSTLAAVTSGYVFTANGANTAPSWQANATVPYTGANANVDLGAYKLTTTGTGTFGQINVTGVDGNNVGMELFADVADGDTPKIKIWADGASGSKRYMTIGGDTFSRFLIESDYYFQFQAPNVTLQSTANYNGFTFQDANPGATFQTYYGYLKWQMNNVASGLAFDFNTSTNASYRNYDFRIKGNTEDNLFYTDASANSVGIGTSTPTATFAVVGNMSLSSTGTFGAVNIPIAGNQAIKAGPAIPGVAQEKTLSINSTSTADYVNLAVFNVENTSSRGSFVLSNSDSGNEWSNNFMAFQVHGSTYNHNYYMGNASDAGMAQILAQGTNIAGLQIFAYNDVPVMFGRGNTAAWTINSGMGWVSGTDGTAAYDITTTGIISGGALKDTGVTNCNSGSYLETDTDGNVQCNSSSARYKKNIEDLSFDEKAFLSLTPRTFEFKPEKNVAGEQTGFIAEEVDKIFPELVVYKNDIPESIKYANISTYLYAIVQQQQKDIDLLKALDKLSVNEDGSVASGEVGSINAGSLLDVAEALLSNVGVVISDGLATLKGVVVDNLTAKTARLNKMEMVDAGTGDVYCTWIENGDWQKVKGECSSITTAIVITDPTTTIETPATGTESAFQEITQQNQEDIDAAQEAANQALQAAKQAQKIAQQAKDAAKQAQEASKQAQETANAAQDSVEQTQAQLVNIVSVAALADINITHGTALDSVNLPSAVDVSLSDNTTQSVAVSWDNGTPAYDPNTAGTYNFVGTLTFEGNITNTDNVTTSVNVIVASEPEPEPEPEIVPEPEPEIGVEPVSAGDVIQEAAASLVNGVWRFVKWIFGSAAKSASSISIIHKTGASLSQAASALSSEIKALTEGFR